jgi:putative flippase GtrA
MAAHNRRGKQGGVASLSPGIALTGAMRSFVNDVVNGPRFAVLRDFVRFGAVGAVGFVADTGVVYALRGPLGLYVAGIASFAVAATVTWALNRIWTFKGRGNGAAHRQWALFLAANALGFVLNRGTYFLLVTVSDLCAREPVIAIFAGMLMGMFLNFHMSRKLVFR